MECFRAAGYVRSVAIGCGRTCWPGNRSMRKRKMNMLRIRGFRRCRNCYKHGPRLSRSDTGYVGQIQKYHVRCWHKRRAGARIGIFFVCLGQPVRGVLPAFHGLHKLLRKITTIEQPIPDALLHLDYRANSGRHNSRARERHLFSNLECLLSALFILPGGNVFPAANSAVCHSICWPRGKSSTS